MNEPVGDKEPIHPNPKHRFVWGSLIATAVSVCFIMCCGDIFSLQPRVSDWLLGVAILAFIGLCGIAARWVRF